MTELTHEEIKAKLATLGAEEKHIVRIAGGQHTRETVVDMVKQTLAQHALEISDFLAKLNAAKLPENDDVGMGFFQPY